MNKQLPLLTIDEEAERFLDTADLSEYDLSAMRPHSLEFARKSKQVNMWMPEQLLDAVNAKAAEGGFPINGSSVMPLKQPSSPSRKLSHDNLSDTPDRILLMQV